MLALDSVEGFEDPWVFFAEGPEEAGLVLGTSQERVRGTPMNLVRKDGSYDEGCYATDLC